MKPNPASQSTAVTPSEPGHRVSLSDLMRQVRRLRIIAARRVNDRFSGEYHAVFRGQGIEFDEVREYAYGDDVRGIDWNVTARMGHTYIKRFREERDLTIILAIDVSGSIRFGSRRRTKMELAAELAGLLALSAERNNDNVSLLLFSDRIEKYIPPTRGRGTGARILRELLAFEAADRPTNIAIALQFLERVRKRHAVVFLVSDFLDDGFAGDLQHCSRRHDLIACQITDPLEQSLPAAGLMEVIDPESGATRVIDTDSKATRQCFQAWSDQRRIALNRMFSRNRIDTLNLSGERPVADAVHALFRKRRRRLRGDIIATTAAGNP